MMRTFVLAVLLLCGLSARAQPQPRIDGELLGLDERALTRLFPDVKRLARPVMGPHRARGSWRLGHAPLADPALDTIFFIRARQVVRIEQQALLDPPDCSAAPSAAALLAALQGQYGSGLAANDVDAQGYAQQSVSWVAQGTDVVLHLSRQADQCEVLLVYQPHVEKDASEL